MSKVEGVIFNMQENLLRRDPRLLTFCLGHSNIQDSTNLDQLSIVFLTMLVWLILNFLSCFSRDWIVYLCSMTLQVSLRWLPTFQMKLFAVYSIIFLVSSLMWFYLNTSRNTFTESVEQHVEKLQKGILCSSWVRKNCSFLHSSRSELLKLAKIMFNLLIPAVAFGLWIEGFDLFNLFDLIWF